MEKQFLLYGYSSNTDGTFFSGDRLFTQNKDFRTEEHYANYRECGFNVLLLEGNDPYYGESWQTSQTKKNMDAAYAAGINKIIVYDKRIFDCSEAVGGIIGEGKRFGTEKELEDFIAFCIKDYKNHPAFFGFMLVDEPRWFQLLSLSQVIKATRKVAPDVFIQNNILPFYDGHAALFTEHPEGISEAEAYRKYISDYMDMTEMPYLMYDSYPMRLEPEAGYFIRAEHLPGLQLAAEEVKKRGKSFYFVCQTMAFYAYNKIVYRAPNEAEMRWQVNCVLAFGIKSIGYFTYWRKQRNSILERYVDGASFMTQDGKKTPLYYAMSKIHGELSGISDYLLDCEYEDATYYVDTEDIPPHLKGMEKRTLEGCPEICGDGNTAAVITRLKHLPSGDKAFCVFNANDPRGKIKKPSVITVICDKRNVKKVFSLKNSFGELPADGKISLECGDSVFIVVG